VIELRGMQPDDLAHVEGWLREPHVSRWYLADSSIEEEMQDCRASVEERQPTHLLLVRCDGQPVGWCQWYRCADYPGWGSDVGAAAGDVGIDYAIGDPARVGTGLGTELIAALVLRVRGRHLAEGVVADPDAANTASRRVLEKNGFILTGERPLASEPSSAPMAIYRLPPP
jgi:aminoglycoside 6'-N-acetyltransferase